MKKLILLLVFISPLLRRGGGDVNAQNLDVVGDISTKGKIILNGTSGIAGQVITSAGGADATWANSVTTGGGRCRVFINNNTGQALANTRNGYDITTGITQIDTLDFASATVVGTDFTVNTIGTTGNRITINRTGLYHFETVFRMFVTSATAVVMAPRATADFIIDPVSGTDIKIVLAEDLMELTGSAATGSGTNAYNLTMKLSINTQLTAGDKVTFLVGFNNLRFPSGTDLINLGISSSSSILGFFVSE
jgi:hypothetical protein